MPPAPGPRALTGGRATSWVAAGALAGGVSTYLFQVLGTRTLGDAAYAPISVLWTLQYLVFAIAVVAVEAYVTRAVTTGQAGLRRAVVALTAWSGAAAVVLAGATWVWHDRLFAAMGDLSVVLGLVVLAYTGFAMTRGLAAGAEDYRWYGLLTGGEATVRLLLAAAVLATVGTARGLAWVLPFGPSLLAMAGALALRSVRPAARRRATSASRFLAATTAANAASQILLAAGPLVLVPLGAAPAEVAVFFITVTAARTPLALLWGGGFARVLPPLARMVLAGEHARLHRLALAGAVATLLLAAAGAGATAAVGPPLVAALFGAAFRPDRLMVTLVGGAMLLATGALLLNQFLIAAHRELRLVTPWLSALAAGAVGVAVLGGPPATRVAGAMVVGELTALAALTVTVLRSLRRDGGRASVPDEVDEHVGDGQR